jgi:predicted dehydrogenase
MYGSLRIGLIGLGRHGARYAQHLANREVSGVELVAAWRRDARAGAEQCRTFGCRFEPDLDRLIASPDIDAFCSVVPAGKHCKLACKIAEAGKPLLIEKPLARTVEEADTIIAAFEKAKVALTVAQTLRFDPLTVELRDRSRLFGRLTGFGFEQRLENRGLIWEDDPETSGGGVLIQTAIHTVDALRVVTGRDIEVAGAITRSVHYRKNEDLALVHLFAGDVLGDVRVSKIGRSRHMRFALYFEDGGLEADYIERALYETRGQTRTRTEVPAVPTVAVLLDAFAAHLRGERDNPVPPRDARDSLRAIQIAYASAERRKQ